MFGCFQFSVPSDQVSQSWYVESFHEKVQQDSKTQETCFYLDPHCATAIRHQAIGTRKRNDPTYNEVPGWPLCVACYLPTLL
ncbi:hypothetical protein Pst134EA_017122 [Puccinia striiformis f. sp. tritici]|uniref:hypothetical protein n=1 Tax=Puccinia striiformis f. sp. tritici TaxID=168172 RepID=UPI0020082FA1|nr:hypothetical protein Pst134EA_017122 [Puccinia striiformis f. sp. tritici]KAH9460806.1 hypothetical protein Pst134EA_017122 [Puccinia striiformis f. sp. tritici]